MKRMILGAIAFAGVFALAGIAAQPLSAG